MIQNNLITNFFLIFTTIGDKFFIYVLSIILIFFLIRKKEYSKAKIYAFTIIIGSILIKILKELFKISRPETGLIFKTGYSFPSGHATLATIFFGMLIYLFYSEIKKKSLKITFILINIIFILLIGFSRLYLNVHYLTDVLAGIALGILCIYLGKFVKTKIPWFNKNKLI